MGCLLLVGDEPAEHHGQGSHCWVRHKPQLWGLPLPHSALVSQTLRHPACFPAGRLGCKGGFCLPSILCKCSHALARLVCLLLSLNIVLMGFMLSVAYGCRSSPLALEYSTVRTCYKLPWLYLKKCDSSVFTPQLKQVTASCSNTLPIRPFYIVT